MKKIFITAVILSFLLFGCMGLGEESAVPNESEEPAGVQCRNETIVTPYVEEVCNDVEYQEEECEYIVLNYTVSDVISVDLCTKDGDCVGKSIYDEECVGKCSQAMKRCIMNITNEDDNKAGMWKVGATFTHGDASFRKNPETALILPGETYAFDFSQIYSMGDPPTSATCGINVIEPPTVQNCIMVTKMTTVCTNVTKYITQTTEICE